jgi:hypothetical protein
MAFFTEVLQHDTIAPQVGESTLAEYLKRKTADGKRKFTTN